MPVQNEERHDAMEPFPGQGSTIQSATQSGSINGVNGHSLTRQPASRSLLSDAAADSTRTLGKSIEEAPSNVSNHSASTPPSSEVKGWKKIANWFQSLKWPTISAPRMSSISFGLPNFLKSSRNVDQPATPPKVPSKASESEKGKYTSEVEKAATDLKGKMTLEEVAKHVSVNFSTMDKPTKEILKELIKTHPEEAAEIHELIKDDKLNPVRLGKIWNTMPGRFAIIAFNVRRMDSALSNFLLELESFESMKNAEMSKTPPDLNKLMEKYNNIVDNFLTPGNGDFVNLSSGLAQATKRLTTLTSLSDLPSLSAAQAEVFKLISDNLNGTPEKQALREFSNEFGKT